MAEPVSPESWAAVKALFHELRELPPDLREQQLRAPNRDADTVRDVERLLAADAEVGTRFDRPALLHLTHDGVHDRTSDEPDEDAEPTAPSLVGRRLGAYLVLRRIGEGGMGTVYEAQRADESFVQRVAIKTVWRDVDSTLLARRLRSERQMLATLQHPNIASLIDGGTTTEGLPYLVMEFVDGTSIDAWCDGRRLGIPQRLDLFRQVCAAVAHAHRNLIVHRDLKPSNVFVNAEGSVKLLDFGVAKSFVDSARPGTLTGAGVSPFTVAFAAPEQVDGERITTATDVYALGALLYLLLTGHTYIEAEQQSVAEAILAVREGVVTAPSARTLLPSDAEQRGLPSVARLSHALRGELDAIVMKAMRRDPARRYASVDALADDVHRLLRGDRVQARADTASYRLRTFVRRNRAAAVGIGVTALSLVVGSAVALYQANAIRVEAGRAERASLFLMHMTGEPDAHFGDPFSRLGPQGSIADLRDSTLARVSATFPDDPRIRARVYTALGASLVSSGKVRRASAVLDSARTLARDSYGATSGAYIEATINAANAAIHFQPPRVSTTLAREALAALGAHGERYPELRSRALLALATSVLLDARTLEMDSLAQQVIALERARTRAPTMMSAWAWRLRSGAGSSPDSSLAALHRALAIIDSLGMKRSIERMDVMLSIAAAAIGKSAWDDAERIADSARVDARAAFGDSSREVALLNTVAIQVAIGRGANGRAARLADELGVVVDPMRDVNGLVAFAFAFARHAAYIAAGDLDRANTVDANAIANAERMETPLALILALSMSGDTESRRGDNAAAEHALRKAVEVLASRPDLKVLSVNLHYELALYLARQGRESDAQQQLLSLPESIQASARALLREQSKVLRQPDGRTR